MLRRDRRRPIDPRPRLVDLARGPGAPSRCRPAARNSSARSPISRACAWACSPRESARSGITFARANTCDAVEHLRLERRALALVRERLHPSTSSRRISSMWRAELEPRWMSGAQLRYPMRDDRRHRAATVPELLEELERLLRGARRLVDDAARSAARAACPPGPRRRPRAARSGCARPARPVRRTTRGPPPSCTTPSSRSAAASVASSPSCSPARSHDGTPPPRRRGRPRAPTGCTPPRPWRAGGPGRAPCTRPARLPGPLPPRPYPATSRASSAARSYSSAVRMRRGAAQPDVEPQPRVAERLGQRGELRESLHPVAGPPQHVERPVARLQQAHALLRCGGRGQRELDDAQHLLGRVRGERVPACLDREPHAHGTRPQPPSRDGRAAAGCRPRAPRTSAAPRSPRGSRDARQMSSVAAANSRTCSCWKL